MGDHRTYADLARERAEKQRGVVYTPPDGDLSPILYSPEICEYCGGEGCEPGMCDDYDGGFGAEPIPERTNVVSEAMVDAGQTVMPGICRAWIRLVIERALAAA